MLLSHGKPKAALISVEDLRRLEKADAEDDRAAYRAKQEQLLEEAAKLRQKLAQAGVRTESVATLQEVRQERLDAIAGLP